MPVAVYTCNTQGGIDHYNEMAVRLWGREPQINKDRWCGACKAYDRNGKIIGQDHFPTAVLKKDGKGNEPSKFEMLIERPDGSKKHVLTFPGTIYDKDGDLVKIIITLVDISELVEAKTKIEESEKSYTLMLKNSPFGFAIQKGMDMVVEFANDSIKKIWGKGKNVEGKALLEFLPELKEHGFLQILRKVLKTGIPYYAYEIHAPLVRNGKLEDCYFNVVYQPYYQFEGSISGVTTIAIEVTKEVEAKKRMEESEEKYRKLAITLEAQVKRRTEDLEKQNHELENLNKELELFAQISSHDLQVPLRKAKMAISRLSDEELRALSENGTQHFQKVTASLDAMQKLIKDLQSYWRSDQVSGNFEITDLNLILNDVIEGLSLQIEEKNAEIESKSLGYANVVPFEFQQLLHNLISNAIKFSKPKTPPKIKIESRSSGDEEIVFPKLDRPSKYFHISVSDNGIGFDNKDKEKIFEAFKRLHGKGSFKGTGIGLAIVKKIVDHHNGKIVASSNLNNGATFDIYLPTG